MAIAVRVARKLTNWSLGFVGGVGNSCARVERADTVSIYCGFEAKEK